MINFTLHSRKSYETQVSSGLLLNSSRKLWGKRTINFEDDKFRTISLGDGDMESDYIERKQRLEKSNTIKFKLSVGMLSLNYRDEKH